MSTSENNKRIIKNTAFLYLRMLIVMFVSLYTSRVVLQVLGVTDFGIYNVVGGFVSMLVFFTSSLANVTQRYINISLGTNDLVKTELVFRQSLSLMLLLSILIFIVGETLGLWFVKSQLVIPTNRFTAALWVYQFSLLSVVCSLLQVPFMGIIVAHEKMNMYAYLGLFEAFIKLFVVYMLLLSPSIDSLVLYGGLMFLISVLILVFYVCICLKNFTECKLNFYWNNEIVREMSRFVVYNLFGCISWSAGVQGTNVLLNIFFGPAVNAARGLSVQVTSVVTRFTENITTAVKPQIIKSYAINDLTYMLTLIEKSSKYSYFLAAVISIPTIFELDLLLNLWLGNVPEYTLIFTRLVLIDSLINVFIPSLWIAANATGDIRRSQVYGRVFTLLILPISYLLLKICSSPVIPFVITIFCSLAYWCYCVYDIQIQLNLNVKKYIHNVVFPSTLFTVYLIIIGCVTCLFFPQDSFVRFIVLALLILLFVPPCIYILSSPNEKEYLLSFLKKKL